MLADLTISLYRIIHISIIPPGTCLQQNPRIHPLPLGLVRRSCASVNPKIIVIVCCLRFHRTQNCSPPRHKLNRLWTNSRHDATTTEHTEHQHYHMASLPIYQSAAAQLSTIAHRCQTTAAAKNKNVYQNRGENIYRKARERERHNKASRRAHPICRQRERPNQLHTTQQAHETVDAHNWNRAPLTHTNSVPRKLRMMKKKRWCTLAGGRRIGSRSPSAASRTFEKWSGRILPAFIYYSSVCVRGHRQPNPHTTTTKLRSFIAPSNAYNTIRVSRVKRRTNEPEMNKKKSYFFFSYFFFGFFD